ncbi:MAG: efflux RND transporter periplasmic adaptor subunit [Gammaproteobacteria bacterium]|nr:efflux RND transporter periplasmic adaptor subunit [Gammaproteobacteria bacterium]
MNQRVAAETTPGASPTEERAGATLAVPEPQRQSPGQEKAVDRAVDRTATDSRNEPVALHVAPKKPSAKKRAPSKSPEHRMQELLVKRQAAVLQTVTEFVDQDGLATSLLALAGELHNRFHCERVAIGLYEGENIEIAAVSQQANLDTKTVEARLLVGAMVEACEQDTMIHYPRTGGGLRIVEAHEALIGGREHAEVCTIPLCHERRMIGAVLFERSSKSAWSPLTLELFHQIAVLAAPMVTLRQQGEQTLWSRIIAPLRDPLETFLRPRHVLAKCLGIAFSLMLIGAHFLQVTHNVTADAELVAMERRVITAPMVGYIEAVNFRPGDEVSKGDVLVLLDARDLELERTKWNNEIRSADSEFRSAMASRDRKEMAVTQARQRQAQAQLDLIDQQIARSRIVAPTDGMVLTGDLSQALGAPVERGDTLLEIAPDQGYEAHLLVDERDIPYVAVGQQGTLTLTASPVKEQTFTVQAVHPIARAVNGLNTFRVEARLSSEPAGLRPGQTGVGKIDVGQASLLWLWTHRFIDWMRLTVWEMVG